MKIDGHVKVEPVGSTWEKAKSEKHWFTCQGMQKEFDASKRRYYEAGYCELPAVYPITEGDVAADSNFGGSLLTVLECTGSKIAAKTHTIKDGKPFTLSYNSGKWFAPKQILVFGIYDLHKLLVALGDCKNAMIIRGQLNASSNARADGTVRRAKNIDKKLGETVPYFVEAPCSWVMFDFDKVPNPACLDPTSVEAMCYLRSLLPPEFRAVVCSYSLSSSAGISGSTTISAHLWFCLDRPVGEGELKRWLAAVPVDKASFRTVQPHYVATPIFSNGRLDPIVKRKGLLEGVSVSVKVPVIPMKPLAPSRLSSSKGGEVGEARGYEAKMALLGDGPGCEGCHNVITSAIAAYFLDHGPGADQKALKHDIRRRVEEAYWDPARHPQVYLERETCDEVLDRSIADWISKAFLLADAYPLAKKLTREDASVVLSLEIKNWVEAALRYHNDKIVLEAAGTKSKSLLLSQGGEDMFPPPRFVVDADVGLGKTRAYISVLRQLVDGLKPRHAVLITVPTHDLANELVVRIADLGLEAAVYRGPRQPDPDSQDKQMCLRYEDYAVFQAAGAQGQLCKVCNFRLQCGFLRQKKRRAKIWIAPHNILFHARSAPIAPIDFLIVDEDPTKAGFEEKAAVLQNKDAPYEMQRAIKKLPLGIAFQRSDFALSDQRLHRLEKDLWAGTHRVKLRDDADDNDIAEAKLLAAQVAKDVAHAKLLNAISQNGVGGMRCFEVETERCLGWTRQRRIHQDFNAPTLFLDATPNWERLRHLYDADQAPPNYEPETFIDEDGSVAIDYLYPSPPVMAPAREIRSVTPFARVRQVVFSAARARFFDGNEPTGNLAKVHRRIEAIGAHYQRMLVICQQDVEGGLRECSLPAHVEVAHFNAIRGRDEWKDVDCLIIVGRLQPPVDAVEIHAEAMFGKAIKSIQPDYYNRVWQPLTGHEHLVPTERHPDLLADIMRYQACEAELIQAIGRGRAVNRTVDRPLQIEIINQVPLPNIEVDEVVSWEDAMPSAQDVILGRYGLLLPGKRVQGWAHVVQYLLPDMFNSARAAGRGAVRSVTTLPNKELYIAKSVSDSTPRNAPSAVIGLQVTGGRYMVPAIVLRPDLMMVNESGNLLQRVGAKADEEPGFLPTEVKVMADLPRRWNDRLKLHEECVRLWGEVYSGAVRSAP